MKILNLDSLDKYGLIKEDMSDKTKYYVKDSKKTYFCVDKKTNKGEVIVESSKFNFITLAQKETSKTQFALDKLAFALKQMVADKVIEETNQD